MATAPHILSALSAIVVRNEFCEKVDQAGGIIHILDILAAHPDTEVSQNHHQVTCTFLL